MWACPPDNMIKKIEDLDYYELLNVDRTASEAEIEKAYRLALDNYQSNSLATYKLLSAGERKLIIERIEAAYQVLSQPQTRKLYDLALSGQKAVHTPKVPFRKTLEKVAIEEVLPVRQGFFLRLRKFFSRTEKK